jgi:predicted RNA-binding Zn-ribbon protein involved in translation (DUF1610 family)
MSASVERHRALRGTVHCDSCGWDSVPDQVLTAWFDRPCPQCGGLLINAGDKALIDALDAAIRIGLAENCKPNAPGNIHIDTRKNHGK